VAEAAQTHDIWGIGHEAQSDPVRRGKWGRAVSAVRPCAIMMRCAASRRQWGYRVLSQMEFEMIKSDLVLRIRQKSPHLRLRDVEKIVDALFDEITASLARGKRTELRGFGTFSVKVHEARIGRNPQTGAPVPVPKRAHPHFKMAKEMKARLNRRTD
jgi:integration host factor subunit beta